MIDMGVASPNAQGQAMINPKPHWRTAYVHDGSGPNRPQERRHSRCENRWHEPERYLVGHALHGARTLRLRHGTHDLGQHGFDQSSPRASPGYRYHWVAPMTWISGGLCHGIGSGQHRLVDAGHFPPPRCHPREPSRLAALAGDHRNARAQAENIVLGAIGVDAASGLGASPSSAFIAAEVSTAREARQLSSKVQRHDDRSRLEIPAHPAVVAERGERGPARWWLPTL